jgi:hypothetical protein
MLPSCSCCPCHVLQTSATLLMLSAHALTALPAHHDCHILPCLPCCPLTPPACRHWIHCVCSDVQRARVSEQAHGSGAVGPCLRPPALPHHRCRLPAAAPSGHVRTGALGWTGTRGLRQGSHSLWQRLHVVPCDQVPVYDGCLVCTCHFGILCLCTNLMVTTAFQQEHNTSCCCVVMDGIPVVFDNPNAACARTCHVVVTRLHTICMLAIAAQYVADTYPPRPAGCAGAVAVSPCRSVLSLLQCWRALASRSTQWGERPAWTWQHTTSQVSHLQFLPSIALIPPLSPPTPCG